MGWTLRKAAENQIFENKTFEEIRAWATNAQINPFDQLSHNGAPWVSAFEIPELEMYWTTALNDGSEYGPSNPSTLIEFVEADLLSPDALAVHRLTREKLTIRQLVEKVASERLFATQKASTAPFKPAPKAPRMRDPAANQISETLQEVCTKLTRSPLVKPAPTLPGRSDPYPEPPLVPPPPPSDAVLPRRA